MAEPVSTTAAVIAGAKAVEKIAALIALKTAVATLRELKDKRIQLEREKAKPYSEQDDGLCDSLEAEIPILFDTVANETAAGISNLIK
jgi:hypothetical protein